jgi:hypothetical protein
LRPGREQGGWTRHKAVAAQIPGCVIDNLVENDFLGDA